MESAVSINIFRDDGAPVAATGRMIEIGQVRKVRSDFGSWKKDEKILVGDQPLKNIWYIFTMAGQKCPTIAAWIEHHTEPL